MAYRPLSDDSGSDEGRRREEAADLVNILSDYIEGMTSREATFVEEMGEGGPVSVNQLFWLRDLRNKYAG